ncbi:Ig domain-containing protein [Deinococcus sp. MIMF12]|uniref:Ig domain-containing protein n=1 Tax=Deinococcus rhizophilus TaxID=3049544 RepID=A0ABT7JJR0_9DEIO|nr:Ig domain-containing protein [Deinococcus rhizophilus]MDL2345298.1 Ig domain-containing protein [Deinococcus rhizophilus]
MRQLTSACVLLLGTLVLGACGDTLPTGSGATGLRDALNFTTTSLPVAYAGERYEAPVTVSGGAGPYTVRLASGTLPPGVTLSGMRLTGAPTKTGAYTFTLEMADANLSSKVREYTLNVNELPPLAVKPQLPTGELRGETRIPLNITAPRTVRAARVTWELPEGVTVTRVQPADAAGVLFWKVTGRTLTVDLGFKSVPANGTRVALVGLRPEKVVKLDATRFAFEARDGAGKLLAEQKLPAPPAPAPRATPAPAAVPTPTGTGTTAPASSTTTPPAASPATTTPSPTAPAAPTPTPPTTPGSGGGQ